MTQKKQLKDNIQSIGLFIITKDPRNGSIVVILRRRGGLKFGVSWKSESWAGAHVASVHGKTKWEETPKDTLWRKAERQLGDFFCRKAELFEREIFILSENKEKKIKTYGVCVHPNCISHIQFDPDTAGIVVFPLDLIHSIRHLSKVDEKTPITNLSDVAMFTDEIEALGNIRGNKQLLSYLFHHC